MDELTDEQVFGKSSTGMPATSSAPAKEMSDDEVFGNTLAGHGRRFVQDAASFFGGALQGAAEAIPEDSTNVWRQRAGQMIKDGYSYEEAKHLADVEEANGQQPAPRSPTATPLYQAGSAITQSGKGLTPGPVARNFTGDLAGGAASLASGMAIGMAPRVGPMLAAPLFVGSGMGEAAERARTAGATDAQTLEATRQGAIPGATDLADIELAKRAMGTGTLTQRLVRGLITGGIIEGTQEGTQQFIQNMIAKGVYNPAQDLWEGVAYNALLGAVLGGGAKATIEGVGGNREAPAASRMPNLLGISPAEAAIKSGPTAATPSAPAPTSEPIDLPASVGGPPLTENEKNALQLEREILRQELMSADVTSPEFRNAAARLKRISFELKTTEESEPPSVPQETQPISEQTEQPFTVKWDEDKSELQAVTPNGQVIGSLADAFPEGTGVKPAFTADVAVDAAWRRKGVASALYNSFAERHNGNITPAGNTTPEAWEFWLARYPDKVVEMLRGEAKKILADVKTGDFPASYAMNAINNGYSHPRIIALAKDAFNAEVAGTKWEPKLTATVEPPTLVVSAEPPSLGGGTTSTPVSAVPSTNDLHGLTRQRLDILDQIVQAAHSGDQSSIPALEAQLNQVEEQWQAAGGSANVVPFRLQKPDPNAPQREAWHGSPARHTGFQAEYLKTGEGNMVKGSGFYFAEAKEVSEEYTRLKAAQKVADAYVRHSGGDRAVAARKLRDLVSSAQGTGSHDIHSALDIVEGRKPSNTLYQINLEVEREHLLDFDLPWAQQSPYVRTALQSLRDDPEFKTKEKANIRGGASWRGQTGEAIYNEISRILSKDDTAQYQAEGDNLASALLLKHGIPGSQFLDQFSRRGLTRTDLQKKLDTAYGEAARVAKGVALGQGVAVGRHIADLERQVKEAPEKLTRNFVIFDPKKIHILTANGEPVVGAKVIQPEGMIRQAAGAPRTIEQTAQEAIHYGNLHLAVYNEETKEVTVSRPVSLTKEVPQSVIPSDNVILHDDTIIEWAPGNQQMFSEVGQQRFGKRFDEYNYGVGEVFKGLRAKVAEIMPGGRYRGTLSEAVGVSFGFGYRNQGIPAPGQPHGGGWHGVSFKKYPFSGYFVNPFLAHFSSTPEEVATSLMATMVHELAHHTERREDQGHGPFAHEMQAIQIKLATDPSRAYEKLKAALTLHVRDHWDVYQEMERIPHVFDVRPLSSSKQWGPGAQSAGDAQLPRNNGGLGFGGGSQPAGSAGVRSRSEGAGPIGDDGGVSVSYPGYSNPRDNGAGANHRALSAVGGSTAVPAVPIQTTTQGVRSGLTKLFAGGSGGAGARTAGPGGGAPAGTPGSGNIGGLPPIVAGAAAQADSMNAVWKYWYGLDQAADNNPNFPPILRYREDTQRSHLEESKVHDMGLQISKEWERLSPVQNAALTALIHDATAMVYLTPQEVIAKVVRRPTQQEEAALFAKHGLKSKGQQVYRTVNGSFDLFLDAVAKNAQDEVTRNVTDPVKNAAEMKKIADQVAAVKSKPFFPFQRIGSHYVAVNNSAGQLVLMEMFERRGVLPARYFQKKRAAELRKQFPGHEIIENTFSAEVDPLAGLPALLLGSLQGKMTMTPAQQQAARLLSMTSARSFSSRFKGSKMPGYSMDLLRSYSKFFFHGGRYYAHTKYGWMLRGSIEMARKMQTNKASALADYMDDHLKKTILDARGDFGKLKGFIFLWGLGYSPAAATANLTQLPMVVLPFFNAKFGMTKGGPALIKAMGQVQNYYKRGAYAGQTDFVSRALEYGISTGRITEAQAPELAGLSIANNLNNSVLGTRLQRGWKQAFQKSAWLFEMSEQIVRRVTYRAALDLALKYPNSKATQEAVKLHPQEVLQLQAKFSPAEARAIVTAGYMTETPNFVYAKWARPRAFRAPLAGVVLVFQKYMQSLLTMMKTHPTDFLPQFLLINMLVYGMKGFPGSDDLIDIVKALASRWFGKHYNLEEEARKYVLDISGGKVEPDLILHGLSRKGWGLPALVDLMGERPGRGLSKDYQPGQNVPFPQFDRSKTGPSKILPFDLDKVLDPSGNPNAAIGEQGARASGAVFSVGFNFYKFLVDSQHGWGDTKAWEKIFPRELKDASRAYRVFEEGRERGSRGGPSSADTVVPYDVHDTENMMEIIGMGIGYQPMRQSEKWGQVMAQVEVEKFYHSKRTGLMSQFAEMVASENAKGREDTREAIVKYNMELPEWAKGQAISTDSLIQSVEGRMRAKNARESGVPEKASDVGIAKHVQGLHPGAIVDVRKVK